MARAIEIVPSGGRTFEVTIHDDRGSSVHEIAVPEDVVPRLPGDLDHSLQDVVVAALTWLLERQDRQDLDAAFSLARLREREGFDEALPGLVQARASERASSHQQQQASRQGTDPQQRLVEETRQAQADGEASTPTRRY